KNLAYLFLADTEVSDESVQQLQQFEKLKSLDLKGTKISKNRLREVVDGLPLCRIVWAGGVFEPASDADRKAAVWVLSIKGSSVHVSGVGEVKEKDKLPEGPFRLTAVYILTAVKADDLAVIEGCQNIRNAYLIGSEITDKGLAHFTNCKNLTDLSLTGARRV